jgi:hypothetical protein
MGVRVTGLMLMVAAGFVACDRGVREADPSPADSQAASPVPAPEPQQPSVEAPIASPPATAIPQVGPPPETLATKLPASDVRASLPPLPMVAFTPPRSAQDVRMAYEFAALHPEVLKYVPCFCGCERSGHPHNESCFIASRDDQGRVLRWDTHGMG